MRLIDADELREDWLDNGMNEHIYDTNAFLDSIDQAPTVDAEPVKHGRWEAPHGGRGTAVCSVCQTEQHVDMFVGEPVQKYCGNCGAKMDGGEQ